MGKLAQCPPFHLGLHGIVNWLCCPDVCSCESTWPCGEDRPDMRQLAPVLMQPALKRLQRRPAAAPPSLRVPLISVVIVNYRRWEETAALVDQLLQPRHIHR